MLLTEYNAERVRELDRADGYEEGHSAGFSEGIAVGESKGRAESMREIVRKFLKSGKDTSYIAEFLEISLEEVEKYSAEL